jgi:hypothetical protein
LVHSLLFKRTKSQFSYLIEFFCCSFIRYLIKCCNLSIKPCRGVYPILTNSACISTNKVYRVTKKCYSETDFRIHYICISILFLVFNVLNESKKSYELKRYELLSFDYKNNDSSTKNKGFFSKLFSLLKRRIKHNLFLHSINHKTVLP